MPAIRFDYNSHCLAAVAQDVVVNGDLFDLGRFIAVATAARRGPSPRPGCRHVEACRAADCGDDGACEDLWTEARCVCRPGFSGARCRVQGSAQFGARSMLHFAHAAAVESVSLWVTATQPAGVLLYTVSTS